MNKSTEDFEFFRDFYLNCFGDDLLDEIISNYLKDHPIIFDVNEDEFVKVLLGIQEIRMLIKYGKYSEAECITIFKERYQESIKLAEDLEAMGIEKVIEIFKLNETPDMTEAGVFLDTDGSILHEIHRVKMANGPMSDLVFLKHEDGAITIQIAHSGGKDDFVAILDQDEIREIIRKLGISRI